MGGQACIFYGAAEFSRDLDLLILVDAENLARLRSALEDLQAEPVAVPALEIKYLDRGHGVHFRCHRPDVIGLRIDLMSVLRGVASFQELWERRTSIEVAGETVDLLALEDLVRAKKTQRDKDWPMIRRLVERSYFGSDRPSPVEFWLRELRSPELLLAVAATHPEKAREIAETRPAVGAAMRGDEEEVASLLEEEERRERQLDRDYWLPLKRELEQLRRARHGPAVT
jgi:hypothetical protein